MSALDTVKSTAKALPLAAATPTAGTGTVWMESRPREIDLKRDQVEHCLGEIGALDTIGKQWSQAGLDRRSPAGAVKQGPTPLQQRLPG